MKRRNLIFGSASSSMLSLVGCGGSAIDTAATESVGLKPPSVSSGNDLISARNRETAKAWGNEVEAILNYSHQPSWVYYTDPTGGRWYISPFELYTRQSGIYSLGPLTDGQASWWTVATMAVSGVSVINTLTTGSIPDNQTSDTFYDIGRRINVTNPQIHSDRNLIRNSSVPAKWYFFSAPNGRWYIVADPSYGPTDPPVVRRFDSVNENYNWVDVDTTGVRALFQWSLGQLYIRFSPISRYVDQNRGTSRDMDGAYGSQCVDLMHHYIDSALGISYPHGFTGNAFAIYTTAENSTTKTSAKYGRVTFTKVENSISAVPEPGDIIFWSAPDPGHVAIVIEATSSNFSSIDQNWVNPSETTGSPAAVVQHSYTNVAGWLSPSW